MLVKAKKKGGERGERKRKRGKKEEGRRRETKEERRRKKERKREEEREKGEEWEREEIGKVNKLRVRNIVILLCDLNVQCVSNHSSSNEKVGTT